MSSILVDVFRVEHPSDGVGPYQVSTRFTSPREVALSHYKDHHGQCDMIPSPILEGHLDGEAGDFKSKMVNYRSAFTSLEDLKSWFQGMGEALHHARYVISKYQMPEEDILRAEIVCFLRMRPSGQVLFRNELQRETFVEHLPLLPVVGTSTTCVCGEAFPEYSKVYSSVKSALPEYEYIDRYTDRIKKYENIY